MQSLVDSPYLRESEYLSPQMRVTKSFNFNFLEQLKKIKPQATLNTKERKPVVAEISPKGKLPVSDLLLHFSEQAKLIH